MGNSASSNDHSNHDWDEFDGIDTLGYRVLGVQPESPASAAGLVSFFDFIVGADEKMLLDAGENLTEGDEYNDVDFPALLQEHLNKPLELLVWNIKSQQQRLVSITPSNTWGGAGLLGVTIRLDNYGGADERLIRVLSVEHQSPAAIAGLVPLKDYLLGTTTDSFTNTTVLSQLLHQSVDTVIELYVYNVDSDVVRVVSLLPTYSWGGGGLLGAEVGTGYLHRLPQSCRETNGKSVERKVRVVVGQQQNSSRDEHSSGGGMAPPPPRGAKQQQQQQPADLLAVDTKQQQQRRPVMLEVEPQLEMEVEDEDEARPEDTNKTVYQVADHHRNERKKKNEEQESGASSVKTDASVAATDNKSAEKDVFKGENVYEPPATPAQRQQKPVVKAHPTYTAPASRATTHTTPAAPPLATVTTYSPSPVDAEALFSAGPPPAAMSFLPPPPMSFLASENKQAADSVDDVDLR